MLLVAITSILLLAMKEEYRMPLRLGTRKTGWMQTTSAHIQTSGIKQISTTPPAKRRSILLQYIWHTPPTLLTSRPQRTIRIQTPLIHPPWLATATPKTHPSSPHHSHYSAHPQSTKIYHLQLSSLLSPLPPHRPDHQTTTNYTHIPATATTTTTKTTRPLTR